MRYIFLIASLFIATTILSCKKNSNTYAEPGNTTTANNGEDNPNSSNGDGDDNPGKKHAKVDYRIAATNTASKLAKVTAGNLQWASALANPQVVKFEAKQGASEIEYKSTNTTQVDIMTALTGFGNVSIPTGTYSEIELKIQLSGSGSVPALVLKGMFNNGTLSVPVEVTINEFVELKTEQHNVNITGASDITMVTNIDLSSLANNISEADIVAATLTGGTLVISQVANKTLYNKIMSNLANRKHHVEVETHHK